jgi:hypothetical protein
MGSRVVEYCCRCKEMLAVCAEKDCEPSGRMMGMGGEE